MIRLFKVYFPVRTVALFVGEALVILLSFELGVWAASRLSEFGFPRPALIQAREGPTVLWLLAITGIVLLLSHVFDLYDSDRLNAKSDQVFRLLWVLGMVSLVLSALGFAYSRFLPGRDFLPRYSALWGFVILTFTLLGWRSTYGWLVQQRYFRERVYVLGTGERAGRLLQGLRQRTELGIEVVGSTGDLAGEPTREEMAAHLVNLVRQNNVHRVIVTMSDRRGVLPVDELLDLRLSGVKIEDATSWLERINGRIEVEQLYPSWLIFAEGFRFNNLFLLARRAFSMIVAAVGLLLSLPLWPFIMLAIRLDSPGPILYRQKRVGRGGHEHEFICYKFRTMCQDAEADTGATWATDDDPRITRVGRFLRASRLDEIPQLWCVLKGDMAFVGPRPERPEFVKWLREEIPYYDVRHTVRPGITGWAQVRYKYGNTREDAREKLQYDLFYIKNASIGLDLLIIFQTIKIVLLGRGAK